MNKKLFFIHSTLAALIVAGLDPAIAQQVTEMMEEVIVVEAPIERRQVGPAATASGMKSEIIELRRRVGFADLDLRTHADIMKLRERIEMAAKDACERLEEMFPMPRADSVDMQRCVDSAIKSAEEDLQAAIAAAE